MKISKSIFITVLIERKLHNKITAFCRKNRLSIDDFVNKAVSDYLKSINNGNVANEVFREFEQALGEGALQTKAVGSFIKPKTRRQ